MHILKSKTVWGCQTNADSMSPKEIIQEKKYFARPSCFTLEENPFWPETLSAIINSKRKTCPPKVKNIELEILLSVS